MFEVPPSRPRANPWRLALLWMGAAAINAVGTTFVYPLLFRAFDISPNNYRLIGVLVYGVTAFLIMVLQWLALRRFFPGLRWWLPAHGTLLILGLLLQDGMTQLAAAMFDNGGGMGASLGAGGAVNLFWSLLTGMVGWWLFRPLTRRAWLWPAALLLGTLLQALVNILVLWPMIESGFSGANPTSYVVFAWMANLLGAAIQAAVLALFLRDQRRPGGAAPLYKEREHV